LNAEKDPKMAVCLRWEEEPGQLEDPRALSKKPLNAEIRIQRKSSFTL
jgi:hypothetical protein